MSFDLPLRYAELASRAASSTSTAAGKTLAWSNLQRLRHALEEMIGPPDLGESSSVSCTYWQLSEPFEQVGYRLMQCIAPYVLGDREVTLNVDADAIRCYIILLDLGCAKILYDNDRPLLQNLGNTVMARALLTKITRMKCTVN